MQSRPIYPDSERRWCTNFPPPPVCKITGLVLGVFMISGGIDIYLKGEIYFPMLFAVPRHRLACASGLVAGGILLELAILLNRGKKLPPIPHSTPEMDTKPLNQEVGSRDPRFESFLLET